MASERSASGGRPRRTGRGVVGDLREDRVGRRPPIRRRELGPQRARRGSPRPGPRPGRAARRPRRRAVAAARAVPVERGEQLGDALAGRRGRSIEDRRGRFGPRPRRRRRRVARPRRRPADGDEHRPELRRGPLGARARSPLFTTTMSATSSRPALIAWTSSPISGASRTTVVSAAAATSTSLWPVPTVSMRTRSKPARVEHRRGRGRRRGEPAGVAARRHRADEHVAVRRRTPASGRGRRAARRR